MLAADAFTFLRLGIHVALLLGARDGASPPAWQRRGRLPLPPHGELRHASALLAFGLLAGPSGGYEFEAMAAGPPFRRRSGHRPRVLALIGAGSKAGLVPLHVWLPLAHPAAPTHVSALMSGVMTKVAVYGFMRIVFDLLGAPAWWWARCR